MFKVQAIAISEWLISYLNDINVIIYLPRFLKTLPPNRPLRSSSSYFRSLRKHPFLLALRRWERFAPATKSEEKRMLSQAIIFGQNSQYRNYECNHSFSFSFFLLFFPFKGVFGCKKPALCSVFSQMAKNFTPF